MPALTEPIELMRITGTSAIRLRNRDQMADRITRYAKNPRDDSKDRFYYHGTNGGVATSNDLGLENSLGF